MRVEADEPCPLPDHRLLAEAAEVVRDCGDWGWIVDRDWNLVYVTDEERRSLAAGAERVPIVVGEHIFGPAVVDVSKGWLIGGTWRHFFEVWGGVVLSDTPGGRDELCGLVDDSLHDVIDDLSPWSFEMGIVRPLATGTEGDFLALVKALRVRAEDGTLVGTMITFKPAAGMDVMGILALERDLSHLQRTLAMGRAARRPAAILFADLERSSALARTLSTANYFNVGRRIMRATDRCVVDAGGVAGAHVGDGVVAFFPAELFDSVSDAARACICAARAVQAAMLDVATRSGLAPEDLVMRFGLHWGSTIFIGNISTAARGEVTALGDEVNETARIEACATGGRMLASKGLIERLTDVDAAAVGVDPDRLTYTQLADLASATDKARRDAPAIAVCAL
jgi:class 3 adenylate cyclase